MTTTRANPTGSATAVPAPKAKAKAKAKAMTKEELEAQRQRDEVTRKGEAFFRSAPKHMEENQVAIRQEQERLRHLEEQSRSKEHVTSSLEQMNSYDLSEDELLLTAQWRPPSPPPPLGTHDANTDPPASAPANENKNKTKLDKIKDTLRKPSRTPKDTGAARQNKSIGNIVLEKGSGLEGIKATMRRKQLGPPGKHVPVNDAEGEEKGGEDRGEKDERDGADGAIVTRSREGSGDMDMDIDEADDAPPPPSSTGQSAGAEFFAKMKHVDARREDEVPIPPSSAERRVTARLEIVREEGRELEKFDVVVDPGMCITEAEQARLDDLVDQEDRCPICDNALPLDLTSTSKEFMKQYHRVKNRRILSTMSEQAQMQFCALHDAESQWIPLGRMRGYPDTIDWQEDVLRQLDETWIAARMRHVAKIPTVSPIYTSHAEYVEQNGRDAWVQAVRHGRMGNSSPGFFGIIGNELLVEYFKELDKDGTLRLDKAPSAFMTRNELLHLVLVPEAATLLIMSGHLGWTKTGGGETFEDAYQRANTIREQSILYGQSKFDDGDEGTQALVTLKRHRAQQAQARRARPKRARRSMSDTAQAQASPKPKSNATSGTTKRKRQIEQTISVVDLTADTDSGPSSATRTPTPPSSGSSIRRASQTDDTPKKRKQQHKVEGAPASQSASSQTSSKRPKKSRTSRTTSSSQNSQSDTQVPPPPLRASQDSYAVDDFPFSSQDIADLANIESSAIKNAPPQDDMTPTRAHPHPRPNAGLPKGGSQSTNFGEFDALDFDLDHPSMAAVKQLVIGETR